MKLAIAGCCGRMGLTLVRAAQADHRFTLVAGSERPGFDSADLQTQLASAGGANIFLTDDPAELAKKADAVIDFTVPASTLAIAEAAAQEGAVHIIGTTGFTDAQQKQLAAYAKKTCIVQSGNFSLGINLLEKLVEQATRALDESYDVDIFEMHHRHKKDAPSGTALMLGRAAARGRGVELDKKKAVDRHGERKSGDIGFSIARGGDVVGIHSVMLAGPGEVIELRHQGFSRDIYASGALAAAAWAKGKKPGLYSMKDVLAD
jgi:4-hydroxy-tetrahydrodipicolinate reductase